MTVAGESYVGVRHLVAACLLGLVTATLLADDLTLRRDLNWHQWRGPRATGVAPQGDPPVLWDESTNVKWKARLPGLGSSTPIVWETRVFVLAARDTGRTEEAAPPSPPKLANASRTRRPETVIQFIVLCVDRETGKTRWQKVACEAAPHEGRHPTNTYASGSPTTDGRRLFVSFGSRGVYCYDLKGDLQWKRTLGTMYTRFGWGEAPTPVVHGDYLLHNWDHEGDSFIVALDAKTGETRWKKDRDEVSSWATPLILERAGAVQVIVNAARRVTSYELESGRILWECGGQTVNAIPSPVATEKFVVCMSGWRGSAVLAIPFDSRGDVTGSEKIIWQRDRATPYVPSPLLYGDFLYYTRSNAASLSCVDVRTGDAHFEGQDLPGSRSIYASAVGAAGRVYLVDREGTTLVFQSGPTFKVLATNKLDDPMDASPAVVGKQLFLRGRDFLYCIAED